MTVSSTINREQYATDGVATAFAIHFPFFDDTDVNAVYVDASGNATALALNADYTVSGGGGAGGTLNATLAPAGGGALTIYREIPFTQEDDYVEDDPLPADTLEGGFDRAVMRDQQIKDAQDRALTFPVTIDPAVSAELPNPKADSILGWNATGDALENKTLPAGTAVYSSTANTRAGTTSTEAVTPRALASLWQRGVNLVSASSIAKPSDPNLGGYYVQSGNTQTDSYWAGSVDGEEMEIRYIGVPPLSTSGNLLPPGGSPFQVVAGDVIRWRWDASASKWRAMTPPVRIASITSGTIDGVTIGGTTPGLVTAVSFRSLVINIADDQWISFTPPQASGKVIVTSPNLSTTFMGDVFFSVGSATTLLAGGGNGAGFNINATSGTLTGTTGVDGNVAIRINNADGKIYLENRTGSTRSFAITVIG